MRNISQLQEEMKDLKSSSFPREREALPERYPRHNKVTPMGSEQEIIQAGDTSMARGVATPMHGNQNINVTTNQNIHLERKEWIFRGIIGGIGNVLAFPFRLIADVITGIAMSILGLIKMAAIVVLFPTLIWAGFQLMQIVSEQDSIEGGAKVIAENAGEAAKGIGSAITSSEETEEKPSE